MQLLEINAKKINQCNPRSNTDVAVLFSSNKRVLEWNNPNKKWYFLRIGALSLQSGYDIMNTCLVGYLRRFVFCTRCCVWAHEAKCDASCCSCVEHGKNFSEWGCSWGESTESHFSHRLLIHCGAHNKMLTCLGCEKLPSVLTLGVPSCLDCWGFKSKQQSHCWCAVLTQSYERIMENKWILPT